MPRARPGLSLVEAGLLLCLAGIVLAVFVPTFMRRVRVNKLSESAELLEELSNRAAVYYATSWDGKRHCLPPAAGPTPAAPTVDRSAVDFFSKDWVGHLSWQALGFQPDRPIRYSYSYTPSESDCDLIDRKEPVTVSFRAEGDLDGDGVRSIFERQATIDRNGLTSLGALHVHQEVE